MQRAQMRCPTCHADVSLCPHHRSPGPYSATVKVPVTEFSLRANSVVREPEIQSYWAQNRVYESLAESNPGVRGRG